MALKYQEWRKKNPHLRIKKKEKIGTVYLNFLNLNFKTQIIPKIASAA